MSDTGPLAGVKIVDLAWVVAGPMVGRVMADAGAQVVRVESSQRVETARIMGPFPGGDVDVQRSGLFDNCNAGKLGVTLDLSSEEGRAVLLDLVRWTDVLVESFAPGQMAKWGMSYEALKAQNPRLIMLSTSLMGQSGPMSALAGFGNIGAALSGYKSLVGYPDGELVGPFGPYTDYIGPRYATAALLVALADRDRSGEGSLLDISQVETGVQFLGTEFSDYFSTGRVAAANGNRAHDMAPHGVFPAAGEDRWVAIAVRSDAEWSRLAAIVGGDARAPHFATLAGRQAEEDALEALIGRWTATQDAQAIEDRLQAAQIPAHVVADSRDMMIDPQLVHLNHFVRLPHPLGGDSVIEASRFQLSATPVAPRLAAPTFGRDIDYVLGDLLGYSEDRIAELRAGGVLQ